MVNMFSPIQNHILSRLKNGKFFRYAQIQPKNIPNDLFNYHLQFLVKKGYISKEKEGYSLSPQGIKHMADPVSKNDPVMTSLFKVNVITIISRKNNGKIEILNQLRKSNPSYGKIGVPGGVVKKGERTEDAATRKLKVETGLDATFTIVGIERRMMFVKNELFSDILFPIAYADNATGELQNTEYGENMWVPIDVAIQNESGKFDSIQKIVEVLKTIKKGTIKKLPFFYREDIHNGEF